MSLLDRLRRLFRGAPPPPPPVRPAETPAPPREMAEASAQVFAQAALDQPRESSVLCHSPNGLHRMSYVEWGARDNPHVVVCVHGLTRCGRDFDHLAQALAPHCRVVCPDIVGRGRSDWLRDAREYQIPRYCADVMTLIARTGAEQVDWVGTSMGGLIGMSLAALPNNPIRRMVINDVGPLIESSALRRLAEYVGKAGAFADFAAAVAYIRMVSAPFGPHTDAQWEHLTEHVVRPAATGGYILRYDPAIAEPFRNAYLLPDVDLWPLWDAVRCRTLVLRGAESDLLSPETARGMTTRGPRAKLIEVAGVGHAPTLMCEAQIRPVKDFLLG